MTAATAVGPLGNGWLVVGELEPALLFPLLLYARKQLIMYLCHAGTPFEM